LLIYIIHIFLLSHGLCEFENDTLKFAEQLWKEFGKSLFCSMVRFFTTTTCVQLRNKIIISILLVIKREPLFLHLFSHTFFDNLWVLPYILHLQIYCPVKKAEFCFYLHAVMSLQIQAIKTKVYVFLD